LCHQLALTGVEVEFEIGRAEVAIRATVQATDRTGVEMEALTAVSVAALTLYDMVKAVDRAASIDGVRVMRKDGGRSGSWVR
jgi:cyclic pyranopterin phosphate synthase